MLESLSNRLQSTMKNLRGQARLSEAHIEESMREIRRALLEADVALPVIKRFIESVKEKALGQNVAQSLTPGQQIIKIVQDELVALLGTDNSALNLRTQPPAVILMAGLQGVGKTTSVGKLAKLLKADKKKVMVVSADTYRPAARQQLAVLAQSIDVTYCAAEGETQPVQIAQTALSEAKRRLYDVLIVDTAGRLHVEQDMMDEIAQIQQAVKPIEVLLAVDAQAGQDAVNSAHAFHQILPLTGLIMTKSDGDARGGAILSVREVTGCPIKYLTTGEKPDAIEKFYPDRIVSRILGMGDVLSLIEDIQNQTDTQAMEKSAQKMRKGKGFDMTDLREQMAQMLKMGGASSMLGKIPGAGHLTEKLKDQMNDKHIKHQMAIIDSMTPMERREPTVIKRTRKLRIANGSGTSVQLVNQLLKQQLQMNGMMKKMKNPKMAKKMMGGMGQMLGGMGGMPPRF